MVITSFVLCCLNYTSHYGKSQDGILHKDSGKNFFSSVPRPGSLFGMSIIFSKQEQQSNKPNDKNILKLLHQTYESYVKGNIIEHYPNGNMKYKINHIECKDNKVAKDIAKAIYKIIERNPELDIFNEAPKKQTAQNTQGNSPNIIAMKKNDPRGK